MLKQFYKLILRHEGKQWTKNDAIRDAGLVDPEDVEIADDINYGDGSRDNLLAVHQPKGNKKKLPCIIDVHGGGWFYGSKDLYRHYCSMLAQHGFIVVNFNYHLTPDYLFPTPLEDTNKVVEWMIANHQQYNIDLNNVFLVGDSAGAQIASQYAMIVTNPEYAELFDFKVPEGFQLRAFVGNCGVYNILDGKIASLLHIYFGREYRERSERLDVFSWLTDRFPPSFIMTAVKDQAREEAGPFVNALQRAGVDVTYRMYGDKNNPLAHVFHEDIRSASAKACNDEECAYMKKFVKKGE